MASKCIGKSHEKRIRITVYRYEYDRAIERVTSIKGKRMKILRQSTVESVFGTLINQVENCVLIFNMFYTAFLNNLFKLPEAKPNYSIEPVLLK